MKAFQIFAALLVIALFVTAGSAVAGENKPFYEDEAYTSEGSMTDNPEQAVGSGALYPDRYEDFLYETGKEITSRSEEKEPSRFYGIERSWEFWD